MKSAVHWNFTKINTIYSDQKHVFKIIILDAHESVLHTRVDSTLNWVRSCFWIIRGTQTERSNVVYYVSGFKTILWNHVRLLIYLHTECVQSTLFDTTGIDYAGPLLVKDVYTEGLRMNKSYILLFKCATTRCVHLELTPDMSTPTLILALQRFLARKWFPETFIRDDFKSFESAILKKFLRNNKINWKFILDRSYRSLY